MKIDYFRVKIFKIPVGAHLCAPVPCAATGMVSRLKPLLQHNAVFIGNNLRDTFSDYIQFFKAVAFGENSKGGASECFVPIMQAFLRAFSPQRSIRMPPH